VQLFRLSASEMLPLLSKREISSEEIVRALFERIAACDSKVKAFVHRFEDRAIQEAKRADHARSRGEALGPIHGLPITAKESIGTEGLAVTLGVEAHRGRIADRDAAVLRALARSGAILIGKTNVSQLLLFHESDNPIWGATNNPWNLTRVPGGSSGGEAAAIAAGMSLFGVGTDIGGSIRVPAAFCGIYGLKPTNDRWSNLGTFGALAGQEVIRGQTGPMARTARDLALLFAAGDPIWMAAEDPSVPPIPVADHSKLNVSGLRVGVYEDDGFLPPAASVRRAVRTAADRLKKAGVEVVPFEPSLESAPK
jgi:fatty acid amide hydrolase